MNLKKGSFGPEVEQLQSDLNKLGANLKTDGVFGNLTFIAVQNFQGKAGLIVDGIVGPLTQNAIQKALNNEIPTDDHNPIAGIDIYHNDSVTSWAAVAAANIKFCFIKTSEGTGFIDPAFKKYWASCKSAGIIRGAYHFFRPSKDPIAQAKLFCSQLNLEDTDLPPCMDWEVSDGVAPSTDEGRGLDFLLKVQELTGRKPIIYGGPYFLQDLTLAKAFAEFPLWVAHYGVKKPKIPAPWTDYTFWQTGDKGHIPGISNPCDVDIFKGSISDLKELIIKSKL